MILWLAPFMHIRDLAHLAGKQASACVFGLIILALILLSKSIWQPDWQLARYDFLFLSALAVQLALLYGRLESVEEAKMILVFHVVGTVMELFKTHMGSWVYPEPNLFRIAGVPLFSGFMYAAVGSYLARATRIFDLQFRHHPPLWQGALLAIAIYANFFGHHYTTDYRLWLFAAVILMFRRTQLYYQLQPNKPYRRIPLLLVFLGIALLIWLAENIATFAHIWQYPHQRDHWRPVTLAKYGSWFLLMIISYILTTIVHRPKDWAPR